MKTIFKAALLVALWLPGAFAQSPGPLPDKPKEMALPAGIDPDLAKEAGNAAIRGAVADFLARKDIAIKRYAILPLEQDVDGGYFTMQFRNDFAADAGGAGYELYTRMGDDWNSILHEIAWGQSFGDTMDPATVQKFGRIQGVQGLILGRLSSVEKIGTDNVKARFSMQVFEVETGRLLWGEEKIGFARPETVHSMRLFGAAGIIAAVLVLGAAIFRAFSGAMKRAARPR